MQVNIIDREKVNANASAGENDLDFEEVEPGWMWVIKAISGRDDTNDPTSIDLGYYNGRFFQELKSVMVPLAGESVSWVGELRLMERQYIRVRINGATADDDLWAMINGYRVNLREG